MVMVGGNNSGNCPGTVPSVIQAFSLLIMSRLSLEPLEWNFPRGGETGALVNFHARVHDIIEEIVKPLRFPKC